MSDVLEQFKDEKGQFGCSANKTEGEIRIVLNLLGLPSFPFPARKLWKRLKFSLQYI